MIEEQSDTIKALDDLIAKAKSARQAQVIYENSKKNSYWQDSFRSLRANACLKVAISFWEKSIG